MGEQYFSREPTSAHEIRSLKIEVAGRILCFQTDAGVFSRERLDPGTSLLLKAQPLSFAGRALDLGCGWGPVGVMMAVRWPGAEIVMADLNARAVELATRNLAANGLSAAVFQGDGFSNVPGSFDLIAMNPPIRAGKAVIYRLFDESAGRLKPGGALYAVMRKQQGAESAQRHLMERMGRVEIVERGSGYRVFRATM